ncbi:MAG: UvrD-helicase domain-containing protein [Actinomycetota bacterium]
MTTTDLFDDAARVAIASDLDRNLFVEAGAGTGKTTALVARIVALVRRGTSVAHIAAITFTEAAAAELRERIREALGEAATAGGPGAEECRVALARFDDATVATLHAFAQRVLAEFPVEAGLPPGFEVLDDIQAAIEFGQRWNRFLDHLYDDAAFHRPLTIVGALGFRMARLGDLARLVHAEWDRLADSSPGVPTPQPVPPLDLGAALGALDAAAAYASDCRDASDRLHGHLVDVVTPFRDALRTAHDEVAVLEVLAERPTLTSTRGRKEHWPDKPAVLAALVDADDAVEAAVAAVVGPAVAGLLDTVIAFVRESVEERRRAGRLEFHDLLVLARDLVRAVPAVRRALHDRYHHLLLDEFQDTDPLQIELAVLIATDDPDAGAKPWSACAIPPGRLFVVGDPKQSIYRFRRADIELYHEVRDLFGERLTLRTNFRSRPDVIEFVNAVFAPLFDAGPDGLQAAPDALLAARTHGAPSVTIVGDRQPPDADLAQLRRQEAQELTALVRRIRDDQWPVARRGTDGDEVIDGARYADIAVLLPTRATLPFLEQALEDAGVPARIESQSLVYATAEVQEILAILTAIDDPADEVALVAALRAPALACRDDRLLEFRQAGGRWDYRVAPPPGLDPAHPVVAAMEALRALHERRWWDTVSATVERVIRERRLMELAVARARPRDHWRRIRFVADAARAFADGGGTSLRGFVAWLAQQVEEEARVVEVVVPEPDDDAVRILTVHGAKGLEFPVVVVAGLGVGDRAQVPSVLWGADGTPEFQIGPRARAAAFRYRSAGYADRADREKTAAAAEQVRLLYVAATRARDHLVVSVHHRAGESSPAARLHEPIQAIPDLWRAASPVEPLPRVAAPPLGPEPTDADDGREWAERRRRQIAAHRRRPVAAATALARAAGPGPEAPDDNLAKDEPPGHQPAFRRGSGGTAVGRAVHAVLQTVDLTDGAGLEAGARAQALAEGVPERADEILDLAASALRAPVVRDAVTHQRPYWREVPVAATVDGVLIEGFVDLLVETPDGLVIVDYKTDRVPAAVDLDAALERYTVQGGAYALALETALGRPVARCVFVFARRTEPLERAVTDLRGAVARARAALGASTAIG